MANCGRKAYGGAEMVESLQHKLDRVRPPRVQITYDVEIGNAIVMKEIPFVMGILADLAGAPAEPLPKLKERKFVEIDRDNFNDIMEKIKPRLALRVDNKLAKDDSHISAELFFHSIDDFNPLNVVKQIEPLAKLYEARTHLKDLLTKLDGNDVLDELLQEIIKSTDQRDALKAELGIADAAAAATPNPSDTPAN
jgi:type VI secretion system protein ImpB